MKQTRVLKWYCEMRAEESVQPLRANHSTANNLRTSFFLTYDTARRSVIRPKYEYILYLLNKFVQKPFQMGRLLWWKGE